MSSAFSDGSFTFPNTMFVIESNPVISTGPVPSQVPSR